MNCRIWEATGSQELPRGRIRDLARQTPSVSWLDITGGEPTLRDDLPAIVESFTQSCPGLVFVHFPTNGLLTERIVDAAKEIATLRPPRFVVTVSIDGPPAINDQLRGISGAYDKAILTFRELRKISGLSTFVGMTLARDNVGLIDATVESVAKTIPGFTHKDLHVNIPHVSSHFYHNESSDLPDPDSMTGAIDAYMKKRGIPRSPFEQIERLYQKKISKYLTTKHCPQDCAALMSSCFVAADGTVFPCSIWARPLGNILETDCNLAPLLEAASEQGLRERILRKECPNCWTPCEAYPTLAANVLPRLRCRGRC